MLALGLDSDASKVDQRAMRGVSHGQKNSNFQILLRARY
nr:MAG TPA: hypothetical protein [Caudoviricetes sp.]